MADSYGPNNPPRFRKSGESVEDYRVAMGWDAPPKPPKIGPSVTIKKSCSACACERSESYTAQGDSGMHVYCHHDAVGKRLIGNNTWTTPGWCPADAPTIDETAVIRRLLDLARQVDHALDDSEEVEHDGYRSHNIAGQDFDDVVEALDSLEDLPDDKPGMTLGPAGKAEWALRRLLHNTEAQRAAEGGPTGAQSSTDWRP